jgi:ABC-type phosphate transport system permease subunit
MTSTLPRFALGFAFAVETLGADLHPVAGALALSLIAIRHTSPQ